MATCRDCGAAFDWGLVGEAWVLLQPVGADHDLEAAFVDAHGNLRADHRSVCTGSTVLEVTRLKRGGPRARTGSGSEMRSPFTKPAPDPTPEPEPDPEPYDGPWPPHGDELTPELAEEIIVAYAAHLDGEVVWIETERQKVDWAWTIVDWAVNSKRRGLRWIDERNARGAVMRIIEERTGLRIRG